MWHKRDHLARENNETQLPYQPQWKIPLGACYSNLRVGGEASSLRRGLDPILCQGGPLDPRCWIES